MELYDFIENRRIIDQLRDDTIQPWGPLRDRLVASLEQLEEVSPGVRIVSMYACRRPPEVVLLNGKGTTIKLTVDANDFAADSTTNWHWRLGIKRPGTKLTLDLRLATAEEAGSEILRWLGISGS